VILRGVENSAADTIGSRAWVNPDWDWRFRVSFDALLRERLLGGVAALRRDYGAEYSKAFNGLVDLASERLLIVPLLEALDGAEAGDAASVLDTADDAQPSGLPGPLVGLMQERLDGISLGVSARRRAERLLAREAKTRWENPSRRFLECTFGDGFQELAAFARELPQLPDSPEGKDLQEEEVRLLASNFVTRIREDNPRLPVIEVQVLRAEGYGEYWPHELRVADGQCDLLKINLNEYAVRAHTLEQTLAHELDGHAVFYQQVRELGSTWIDHGALSLIEGWATFREWQYAGNGPPPIDDWLWRIDADPDELLERLPKHWLAKGLPSVRVNGLLLEFFQYPAYQLSYVAGGLWFLRRSVNGMAGLDFLESQPLGDFLYAW
jgi:hypothetical protein